MLDRPGKIVRDFATTVAVFVVFPAVFAVHIVLARFLNWPRSRKEPAHELDLTQVARLLIIRLDEIGDAVLNTPFLRELRRMVPKAKISLVVNQTVYPLMRPCPYVDEVLKFDCSGRFGRKLVVMPWRVLKFSASQFVHRQFDLAILPRREFDLNGGVFLAYLSRARHRIGYTELVNTRKRYLNPHADKLLTSKIKPSCSCQHEVEYNLDVLQFLGGKPQDDALELWLSAEDEEFADRALGVCDRLSALIGISPGSSSALRRWPAQNFASLIRLLNSTFSCRFVIVGSQDEKEIARVIAAGSGEIIDLVGKTTLSECAAVLRRCALVIANDSGPMHIAAAVGTKVVALYGSTCEHRFGPWKNHTIVTLDYPCRPCNQGHVIDSCRKCVFDMPRCLTDLSVSRVFAAVEVVLSRVEVQVRS